MFTLYTTPLSANGRKPLAVSHYLGLEPEIRSVNVYQGEGRTREYLAINPLGKVPTLVDGELTLWESNAILQYVCEAYGDYRLWSRDPRERADISRWLFWESAQWQPAMIPVLTARVGHLLLPQVVPAPSADPDWENAQLQPLLTLLDSQLRDRSFLSGDTITLADFSVAGMAMYLRPCGFPFERFTHLDAWYDRIEALEAWQATAAGPWA
jgi:glutathione S-transferase